MDRCRIWESHADPAVRRVSKPSPDPIYPAYVVGDADKISETTRVAAVTGQKSGSDQLASSVTNTRGVSGPGAGGACGGEVVTATGGGNTESSTSGCESSSTDGIGTDVALIPRGTAPTSATAAATATRPTGLERRGVFLLWEVGSCSNTMPELG